MDHFGGIFISATSTLADRDPVNEDGKTSGLLVPRFRNINKETRHQRFVAATGSSVGRGRVSSQLSPRTRSSRRALARVQEASASHTDPGDSISVRAEMLPRFENYAEIDPNGVVDAWASRS
jgi:hypothetical protein